MLINRAHGLCVLGFMLGACTAPETSTVTDDVTAKGGHELPASITNLDNPDQLFLTAADTAARQISRTAALRPRFTNADEARRLRVETSYFNGEIDILANYEYSVDQLARITWFGNAGADGQWQTADDVVNSYMDHQPATANALTVTYRGAGPDQLWFSVDDDIRYYDAPLLDSSGVEIGIATYTLPGEDGAWFTPDDTIGWLVVRSETPSENRWIMYLSAGADNDWLTLADNQIYRHAFTLIDANGNTSRHAHFFSVGPDALPFTDDDEVMYYNDFTYDAQNRISSSIQYSGGAGADGMWFTVDDFVRSCKTQLRDVNDLPAQTISYRPGPDMTCFTADDNVWGYHDDSFDTNSLLTQSISYYSPGADTLWFTADDVVISERFYE